MSVAILILSAGSSSRMGTVKQILPVGKTTLLGLVIENSLQSIAKKVYCVLGAHRNKVQESITEYDVETIVNANHKDGLSSSIIAGITHLQTKSYDAILIMLGDQPLIDANYLNQMINTFRSHPKKIIASSYDNNLGVPVIISKKFYPELLKLKGDSGAKAFLMTYKEQIIELQNNCLMDVDTKEDYQDFLKSIQIK